MCSFSLTEHANLLISVNCFLQHPFFVILSLLLALLLQMTVSCFGKMASISSSYRSFFLFFSKPSISCFLLNLQPPTWLPDPKPSMMLQGAALGVVPLITFSQLTVPRDQLLYIHIQKHSHPVCLQEMARILTPSLSLPSFQSPSSTKIVEWCIIYGTRQ